MLVVHEHIGIPQRYSHDMSLCCDAGRCSMLFALHCIEEFYSFVQVIENSKLWHARGNCFGYYYLCAQVYVHTVPTVP